MENLKMARKGRTKNWADAEKKTRKKLLSSIMMQFINRVLSEKLLLKCMTVDRIKLLFRTETH